MKVNRNMTNYFQNIKDKVINHKIIIKKGQKMKEKKTQLNELK